MIDFHFITVVWGLKYTCLFLQVGLPSLLSPGNLGKLEKPKCCKYKIFTTSKDLEIIYNSLPFLKLLQHVETEICLIDDLVDSLNAGKIKKISATTACQGMAIERAGKHDTAFIFLNPDAVYPDKFIDNIIKKALDGKRMIVCGAIRVDVDKLVALLKNFYSEDGATISIAPRELLRISLENINFNSRVLFWDSQNFLNDWPAYLFWNVKGKGILQRGIHLPPVLINPVRRDLGLTPYDGNAIDGLGIDGHPYPAFAVPDLRDVYIATDSDEMFFLSLDDPSDYLPPPQRPAILKIASWIKNNCYGHHIEFLKAKIRYHLEDLSPEWQEVEKESDKIINSILSCIDNYNKVLDPTQSFIKQKRSIQNPYSPTNCLPLNNFQLLNPLGDKLLYTGKVEETGKIFQEELYIATDCVDVHMNLGSLYRRLGRYNQAVWHLKQVAKSNNVSDRIIGHYELGICYMDAEMYHEAIHSFENTLKTIEVMNADEQRNLDLAALRDYYTSALVKLIKCQLAIKDFNCAEKSMVNLIDNKYFDINPDIRAEISNLMKKLKKFLIQNTKEA